MPTQCPCVILFSGELWVSVSRHHIPLLREPQHSHYVGEGVMGFVADPMIFKYIGQQIELASISWQTSMWPSLRQFWMSPREKQNHLGPMPTGTERRMGKPRACLCMVRSRVLVGKRLVTCKEPSVSHHDCLSWSPPFLPLVCLCMSNPHLLIQFPLLGFTRGHSGSCRIVLHTLRLWTKS